MKSASSVKKASGEIILLHIFLIFNEMFMVSGKSHCCHSIYTAASKE